MKLLKGFSYAAQGIAYCFKTQLNFRIHVAATILVSIAGYFLKISYTEFAIITICCMLVLMLEMLNTAMEAICDLVSKEYHTLIKITKDVAAGAVLICAIGSVVIAGFIFLPKILLLINS